MGNRYTSFTIEDDGTLTHRRIWAESPAWRPTAAALDAEGRIWCADAFGKRCVLVEEGGRILEEIPAPDGLGVYACMLGGPDGTTLLQCCAPGYMAHERKAANDAQLVATEVEVGRAGLP